MEVPTSGPLRWILVACIYVTWTATSFLTHITSKAFFNSMDAMGHSLSPRYLMAQRSICALVLTVLHLGLCLFYIRSHSEVSLTRMKFATFFHAMATLTTNLSLSTLSASSTFTIKLMEPITSSVLQCLIIGTALTFITKISLPFIVGGAIVFAGNPFPLNATSHGILIAFISNICISMRNITVKQGKTEDGQNIDRPKEDSQNGDDQKAVSAAPNKWRLVAFIVAAAMIIVVTFVLETSTHLLPVGSAHVAAMCSLSAVCHVSTAAISVCVVLKIISVVSHAVVNISKRLLVVLLLYLTGGQSASLSNWLGFLTCAFGLLLYAWGKRRDAEAAAASSRTLDQGQGHDPGRMSVDRIRQVQERRHLQHFV